MARKSGLFSEGVALPHCPRPGVLLYLEDWDAISKATTLEQRGLLVDTIFSYVRYGAVPDFAADPCLSLAWGFVAPKLDRDQETYNANTWKNRYNAYKRGQENPLEPDEWLRQVTSGDQWLPSESESGTKTEAVKESETGSENEPGKISASLTAPGAGAGEGIAGGGNGGPPPPPLPPQTWGGTTADFDYEQERQKRMRMLAGYQ